MTTVAQGIVKTTAIVKQSALGSPGSSGSQLLRRVTSVFTKARDSFPNNEIVSHQQSTGITYGLTKISGKLSGLLSPATYKLLMAAALRKDFATIAGSGALTNVTAATTSGAQGTFTRAAGSWLTDGYKIGDIIRWAGWTTTGTSNNSVNMLIIALTATVMTVTRFDTTAIGAKASGDSVTPTIVGKKTMAPTSGHTNDYFTAEEWYSDISKSELFTDLKVGQIDIKSPATGNATIDIDLVGLGRTSGSAQVCTSPTAVTSTSVMTAANGVIWANGAAVANVTGINLTINCNTKPGDPVIGSNSSADLQRGRIEVSGSFTALFTDTVLPALFDAASAISLIAVMLDNPSVGTSDFITFNMGAIKLTSDTPDDGEKNIVRTYNFTAQINGAGGAALANDNTILTIQDSAA